MSVPEPRSPLTTYGKRGRQGAATDHPLGIAEARLSIVQIQARKGRGADASAAFESHFGGPLPPPGRFSRTAEVSAVSIGPDTWLVTAPFVTEGALASRVETALAGLAAITDQSHGKTALRISGEKSRAMLEKGCRVDLHPRSFGVGSAAVTPIDHVTVVLAQTDEAPTYYLIAPSTLVRSLLDFLTASAGEYGYTLG